MAGKEILKYTFSVTIEVEHSAGDREDGLIEEELREILEEADPADIFPGDGEYHVTSWDVMFTG